MRTHHGLYYDSRIKLLLILLTSALAFALGGGLCRIGRCPHSVLG